VRYISTRGYDSGQGFVDILLEGLMPDGGLAVPERYPQLDDATLSSLRGATYAEVATAIMSLFCSDIARDDLTRIVRSTYRPEVFSNVVGGADTESITPITQIDERLHLMSLSNGPSLAFKDMAMQLLGGLFEYALQRSGRVLNILGATSGDTGSSAEYAMRDKTGISVFMLSPHGAMSPFQQAQMYSLQDPNIHNIAVRGVFDDCQDIVKAVSADRAFKDAHHIGTVNSINWARVAAQVVYYVVGYLRMTTDNRERVSFAVPSGNFGNICAGHIARQMGVPIDTLICATNENDVLDEFIRTGVYRPRSSGETRQTSSPSMDISRASNLERFIFDLVDRDPGRVEELWTVLTRTGSIDLSDRRSRIRDDFGFTSGTSTHADRLATIASVYADTGRIIDPHTADGVHVARSVETDGSPVVCLETALPAKFADTIVAALGMPPPRPEAFMDIEERPQRVTVVDADVDQVKDLIRTHGL